MAFGILDDHKLDSVPGTGFLFAKGNSLTTSDTSGLKRGRGKHADIVLIPQPSDDPRDPLNWPRWKKETCFWMLVFVSSLSDALAGFSVSGYFALAKEFDISVNEVASSFSASTTGIAVFTLILIPLSVKFGHRIVYLSSTFLTLMTCVWAALSPNMASIRASRVFQGISVSAGTCLVANTIEQLYFVHERGSRSCVWIMSQSIGVVTGSLINGYVIQLLSWRLGFWFASIACGLSFIGVFLLVPETSYRRQVPIPPSYSTQTRSELANEDDDVKGMPGTSTVDHGETPNHNLNVDPHTLVSPNPPSLLSQLKIYNGTFSEESMWSLFLRPFPFILSPVTWFVLICVVVPNVCFAFVTVSSSTIFSVTYGFNSGQIGLTNVGTIVGVVLALVTTGPLNDWWVVWMARRNGGVYEPEFRLVFMLSMLFGMFGYVGWAIGNDRHMPWIGAVACLAMVHFSIAVSNATRVTYAIDTHGAHAAHILALTGLVQGFVSYGATFFANGLVLSAGVRRTLVVVAGVQAACLVACVPVYVFGKRVRAFIARHPRLFSGRALAAGSSSGDSNKLEPPRGSGESEEVKSCQ